MRNLAMTAMFGVLMMTLPARAELVVSISKSQQRISVAVDGEEAYRWPVSTGRKGYSTPSGTYRPTRLERQWYSRKYDWAPMPWSVFFHRGYAMHGTTETRNIGRPASHGCVRLRPDNASVLFSMVQRYGAKQTKVVVLDGPLPHAPAGQPMAEGPAAAKPATVAAKDVNDEMPAGGSEHLSAKASNKAYAAQARVTDADEQPVVRRAARTQVATVERLSVSVGSEGHVMRERDAWLRALDRKYGITR